MLIRERQINSFDILIICHCISSLQVNEYFNSSISNNFPNTLFLKILQYFSIYIIKYDKEKDECFNKSAQRNIISS